MADEGSSAAAARRVIVVGAGIVGVACAIHLRRQGCDVTLVDRDEPGQGASFGNAGVLACCSVVPVTTPGIWKKAPGMVLDPDGPLFLRWSYMPRLLPWLMTYLSSATVEHVTAVSKALAPLLFDAVDEHKALAADGPGAPHVREALYHYLYADKAAYEGDAFGWGLRRDRGYAWEVIDGAALREVEPHLAPGYACAVRLRGHGYISLPGDYVQALARAFADAGGRVVKARVTGIQAPPDGPARVAVDGDVLEADAVAVCAGVWSRALAEGLGLRVPMETERGYHLHIEDPSITLNGPIMDTAGKFVATPMDGGLRVAGVVEFGGLDAPPSAGPQALLRRGVKRALPGLTWTRDSTWLGHRPAPADSIPVMGPAPGNDRLFFAFGHHHVGLTAGPKSGRLLADMITGRTPNVDMSPYAIDRFQ
ncbi:MAG: FAD-dependent oxidoreductase [Rhodobacterales bacterium]|nr:FAD-dependent oxidoreductase [Rhodobacterales bacterium]